MKEETIRKLCQKKGMNNADLFVKFFQLRFPNESDEIHSYCGEWIDRFLSGNPICYMDKESIKCYKQVIGDYK